MPHVSFKKPFLGQKGAAHGGAPVRRLEAAEERESSACPRACPPLPSFQGFINKAIQISPLKAPPLPSLTPRRFRTDFRSETYVKRMPQPNLFSSKNLRFLAQGAIARDCLLPVFCTASPGPIWLTNTAAIPSSLPSPAQEACGTCHAPCQRPGLAYETRSYD